MDLHSRGIFVALQLKPRYLSIVLFERSFLMQLSRRSQLTVFILFVGCTTYGFWYFLYSYPTVQSQRDRCFHGSIEICTELITSGRENVSNLSTDYNNRGFAYSSQGQYENAIQDYRKAIRLDDANLRAFSNLGASYLKNGQFDKALESFNLALRLSPTDLPALENRAALYSAGHQYIKALKEYDAAIGLQPNSGPLYCSRASIKREMNDIVGGDTDAEKARSLGENADCRIH